MAENTKYVARVPIVPDDFSNQNQHKDHEVVMDFENNDIYIKNGEGYVNITGQIKESIKQIKDGSAVIHIVTEDTLPPVKERPQNNWYYVITKAKDAGTGSAESVTSYIYYGLVQSYYTSKNYLLIAQNVTSGSSTVQFELTEGYSCCLYIPISYGATFKNHETQEDIEYTIEDRVYALNTSSGSYTAYDVYILSLYTAGTYFVDIDLEGSDSFTVSFDANETSISGLVLPESMRVRDGDCIGEIDDPTWDDPRFIFNGWSTSKLAAVIIDPTTYKPENNMTLFAWFTYQSDPTLLTYYSNYYSE